MVHLDGSRTATPFCDSTFVAPPLQKALTEESSLGAVVQLLSPGPLKQDLRRKGLGTGVSRKEVGVVETQAIAMPVEGGVTTSSENQAQPLHHVTHRMTLGHGDPQLVVIPLP